jgi:D-alanine-D-alanine ligase-like ATP-grasp enzyme
LEEGFNKGEIFYEKLWPDMKNLVVTSMQSVKKNFLQKEYKYCFEIFGYDFIIDDAMHVWLIEINTNPCIEESS